MCGYDLIGFQTAVDRTAFIDYVLRHAGVDFDRYVTTVYGEGYRYEG